MAHETACRLFQQGLDLQAILHAPGLDVDELGDIVEEFEQTN